MGQWEIIALAMGDSPVGKGWEPFAIGNEDLRERVFWRRPPEESETGQWYSTSEACKILKVTPPTLKRMAELGQVPKPVKIGTGRGRLRWSAREVQKLVNQAG